MSNSSVHLKERPQRKNPLCCKHIGMTQTRGQNFCIKKNSSAFEPTLWLQEITRKIWSLWGTEDIYKSNKIQLQLNYWLDWFDPILSALKEVVLFPSISNVYSSLTYSTQYTQYLIKLNTHIYTLALSLTHSFTHLLTHSLKQAQRMG